MSNLPSLRARWRSVKIDQRAKFARQYVDNLCRFLWTTVEHLWTTLLRCPSARNEEQRT
jgi:hypothetical protein